MKCDLWGLHNSRLHEELLRSQEKLLEFIMSFYLEPYEQAMLDGAQGAGVAFAMGLICRLAETLGATRLEPICQAHIDGCLYHGQASLDFVLHLKNLGAKVAIPTTLNVASLNLLHPERNRYPEETRLAMEQQMQAYLDLGCDATWTCAPYQLPSQPHLGQQIAWAESNAIVFANSLLGARTNRYGDFTDICAALTARVPYVGLHCPENRRGQIVYHLETAWFEDNSTYAVLGHFVGLDCGDQIPVLHGLPLQTRPDDLKTFGAAAASSGAVAMFHAVGITPEAPSLEVALQHQAPLRQVKVSRQMLQQARAELSTMAVGTRLDAVSLGTPHYSLDEFIRLLELLRGQKLQTDFFVNTNRYVKSQLEQQGLLEPLLASGIVLILDTCVYLAPILEKTAKVVMTSSAKMAYYAPANLGIGIAFGSTLECVQSAVRGEVWHDPNFWD